MLYSIQTGGPAFDHAFGMPVFDYLAQHPDTAALFARTMVEFHGPEAAAVASAYGLGDVEIVVDLGGGSGNLLAELLHANPNLSGILFELPHVAKQATYCLEAAGLPGRWEIRQGSFFDRVPTGADVYLLSHVIHDWDEASCLTLLGNCRRAMTPDARLAIVEMVLPGANQPSPGRLTDLIMLVHQRGQERTEDEYGELLATAGFRVTRVVPTASPASVIEAVPA